MPQLLALEWSGSEARAAIASRHGHRTTIEQAFVIPLDAGPAEAKQPEQDVGQRIAAELAARDIGQIDVLVAVGRGSVELRQLQLPAAADEELPRMVHLQALVEFNELDEKWPLDFVPIDEPGQDTRTVLAAAMAPALGQRIEEVCQLSGLKMRHLVLRSCAAAALAARWQTGPAAKDSARATKSQHPQRSGARREQVQLLVELFADQADLTATIGDRVLFLRTMRLDVEPTRRQSLVAGIRLTMAAVQNQCGGRTVAGILLCGQGAADAELAKQIEKDTAVRTTLFDPFDGMELGDRLRGSPPANPGRFAAVLGMIVTEFDQARHAIDFLHPRRAVEPKPPRNKWKLAGVAAGILLAAYVVFGRVQHWRLADEVAQLEVHSRELDGALAAADKTRASAAEIGKWADGEVVWLDHLRELSADLPPAQSVMLGRITMLIPSPAAGGEIQLEGWANNAESIATMEKSLRVHTRRVVGINSHEDASKPPYAWQFTTSVSVGKEPKP